MNEIQIVKIIRRLISDTLDDEEYYGILDQLKKNKKDASRLIWGMIEGADNNLAKYLIGLMGDIEAKNATNKLFDLIKNPHVDDDLKLAASTTIQRLGGELDPEQFIKNLKDPVALGRQVVEDMLEDSKNPFFIQKLLEDFNQVNREGQMASLSDMLALNDDKRLINIADPLSEVVDDELQLMLIPMLVNSHHPRAFSVLQRIIRRSKSKQVQNAAQQAIFQLGKNVSKNNVIEQPEYVFHSAYMTSVDGDGSSILLFAVKNESDEIVCLDLVSNIELGIKDSFGIVEEEEGFLHFVGDLKFEQSFFITKVPPSILIEKAREAEERTVDVERPLPLEYIAFRKILDEVSYDEAPGKKMKDSFHKFREKTLTKKEELISESDKLFDHLEFVLSWIVELEAIEPFMPEFIEAYLSDINPKKKSDTEAIKTVVKKVAKKAYSKDFLAKLKKMLNEFAFIAFMANKKRVAELAIVASETLDNHNFDIHPFLSKMVINSYAKRLMADSEFEDDEELDDDELDDEGFDEDDFFDELYSEFEDENPFEDHPKKGFLDEVVKLPESVGLSCFDKLVLLAEKMPKTDFAKFFDPKIKDANLETKIQHVNYLQTAFNGFVSHFTNYFDWNGLRKQLKISFKKQYFNDDLKAVEKKVVDNMRFYEYHQYYIDYAKRIWTEAVFLSKGELKPMKKIETWAAAVEYLAAAINPLRPSQREVADYYEISTATLGKRVNDLKKILNLKVYTYYDDQEYAFIWNNDNLI